LQGSADKSEEPKEKYALVLEIESRLAAIDLPDKSSLDLELTQKLHQLLAAQASFHKARADAQDARAKIADAQSKLDKAKQDRLNKLLAAAKGTKAPEPAAAPVTAVAPAPTS